MRSPSCGACKIPFGVDERGEVGIDSQWKMLLQKQVVAVGRGSGGGEGKLLISLAEAAGGLPFPSVHILLDFEVFQKKKLVITFHQKNQKRAKVPVWKLS